MPSMMTHSLFANKVYNVLEKNLTHLKIKKSYYYWGAQGPDIFFYHGVLKKREPYPLNRIGHALHNHHICDILERMNKFSKQYPTLDNYIKSYVLGFICHYALDRAAHPYVLAMVEKYKQIMPKNKVKDISDSSIHSLIEQNLDAFIIWRELGVLPTKLHISDCLPPVDSVKSALGEMYSSIIQDIYSLPVTSENITEVLLDSMRCAKLLNNTLGIKLPIVRVIESIIGKKAQYSCHITPKHMSDDFDYDNNNGDIWINPHDVEKIEHTDTFHDIFDSAVPQAVRLCAGYLLYDKNGEDLCGITGCLSMSDGIINNKPFSSQKLKNDIELSMKK